MGLILHGVTEADLELKRSEVNHLRLIPLSVVSHAMIAAGVQVLRESGALDFQSDADFLVVQRILEKAMALQQRDDKNSSEKQ